MPIHSTSTRIPGASQQRGNSFSNFAAVAVAPQNTECSGAQLLPVPEAPIPVSRNKSVRTVWGSEFYESYQAFTGQTPLAF
jgi:hypothetical protein